MIRIQSYINGKAHSCDNGLIDKLYPATGEVIAKVERADDALLDLAVQHAKQAQVKWAALTGQERSRILHKIARALHDANEELARLEEIGRAHV